MNGSVEQPAGIRLKVQFGPGFSADLWAWNLRLAEAESGRVEVVWETSALQRQREHRFRARELPEWWPALRHLLEHLDFEELPPKKAWPGVLDDAEVLALESDVSGVHRQFSVCFAPAFWPDISNATRQGLLRLVELLDGLARQLHEQAET